MNRRLKTKLRHLRGDYEANVGEPFCFFYCPILYVDEDVELCRAHVVNQAFGTDETIWTVQRKDLDGFYGAHFEADFVALHEVRENSLEDVLVDKGLRNTLRPRILADGREVEHYLARSEIPKHFTELRARGGKEAVIGLKLKNKEMLDLEAAHWLVDIRRDFRASALGSLIKAAYLTLFFLFGYKYALSAAGHFIGRLILGEFFRRYAKSKKAEIRANANGYFREYVNLVRPVPEGAFGVAGTIRDQTLLVCWSSSGFPWAVIVFVSAGAFMHAVLLPLSDHPDGFGVYNDFLGNNNEEIAFRFTRFNGSSFEMGKESIRTTWPKTGWGPEEIETWRPKDRQ